MIQHYFKAIDVMKDLFIPVHSSVHSYVHWPRLSLSGMAAELSPSQHIGSFKIPSHGIDR